MAEAAIIPLSITVVLAFPSALYGLWAGRSISARRLEGVGPLLGPGTAALIARADGPAPRKADDVRSAPGSKQFALGFIPVQGGAVLDAATRDA
jgi:hypothetical protein